MKTGRNEAWERGKRPNTKKESERQEEAKAKIEAKGKIEKKMEKRPIE